MKNGGIFLPPSQKKIEAVVLMCTMPVCALFHFCIHNIINIIHTYGWFFTLYTSHDIFLYKFVNVIQLCSLVWIACIDGESKFISCINQCICRIIYFSLIILDDSWHLAEIWCPYLLRIIVSIQIRSVLNVCALYQWPCDALAPLFLVAVSLR